MHTLAEFFHKLLDWSVPAGTASGATQPRGCFYSWGVLFVGVLIIRALLFEVYINVPDFETLPGVPETGRLQSFGKDLELGLQLSQGFRIWGVGLEAATPCRTLRPKFPKFTGQGHGSASPESYPTKSNHESFFGSHRAIQPQHPKLSKQHALIPQSPPSLAKALQARSPMSFASLYRRVLVWPLLKSLCKIHILWVYQSEQ